MRLGSHQALCLIAAILAVLCIPLAGVYRPDVIYLSQLLVVGTTLARRRCPVFVRTPLKFMLAADLAYYILVYQLKLPTGSPAVVLSTAPLFALSFFLFNKRLIAGMEKRFQSLLNTPSNLASVLFFISIAAAYITVPTLVQFHDVGFKFSHIAYVANLLFTLPLMMTSYLILTNVIRPEGQLALIALFCLTLLDTGIQLEDMQQLNLAFTPYDVLWFLSVCTLCAGLHSLRQEHPFVNQISIVNTIKKISFLGGLFAASIVVLALRRSHDFSSMQVLFTILGTFLIGLIAAHFVQRKIDSYDMNLENYSESKSQTSLDEFIRSTPVEFRGSIHRIQNLIKGRERASLLAERERMADLRAVYQRMAHDISSPLGALKIISDTSANLEPGTRDLLHFATNRVRAIADDILNSQRHSNTDRGTSVEIATASDVEQEIRRLIAEKSLELGYQIDIAIPPAPDGIVIKTRPNELLRIISNVINNATQATTESKKMVRLCIDWDLPFIRILINDRGPGFSTHVLKNAIKDPVISRKGQGIALFNAGQIISRWGGQLRIFNDGGARVEISLAAHD